MRWQLIIAGFLRQVTTVCLSCPPIALDHQITTKPQSRLKPQPSRGWYVYWQKKLSAAIIRKEINFKVQTITNPVSSDPSTVFSWVFFLLLPLQWKTIELGYIGKNSSRLHMYMDKTLAWWFCYCIILVFVCSSSCCLHGMMILLLYYISMFFFFIFM